MPFAYNAPSLARQIVWSGTWRTTTGAGTDEHDTGDSLQQSGQQSRAPRLFALAVAGAIAVSVIRVASVPTADGLPHQPYTWHSATTEVRTEVEATVLRLRLEREWWVTNLPKMRSDTRALHARLSEPATTR